MKYRKKPVVIEAEQWTGDNVDTVVSFFKKANHNAIFDLPNNTFIINTLEGQMVASVGDYIIKGVNGEFYPCKPDIFSKTYEQVETSSGDNRKVIKG